MAFAAGCRTDKASSDRSSANQGPATPVKIEIARSTTIYDTSEYVATLKSRHSAILGAGFRSHPRSPSCALQLALGTCHIHRPRETRRRKLPKQEFPRQNVVAFKLTTYIRRTLWSGIASAPQGSHVVVYSTMRFYLP